MFSGLIEEGNNEGGDGYISAMVVCHCGQPATIMTVTKEGRNKGRQFYTCQGRACIFFQWTEQAPTITTSGGPSSSSSSSSSSSYFLQRLNDGPGMVQHQHQGGAGGASLTMTGSSAGQSNRGDTSRTGTGAARGGGGGGARASIGGGDTVNVEIVSFHPLEFAVVHRYDDKLISLWKGFPSGSR